MSTLEASLLQERWSWIAAQRGEIATALRQLSAEMPRPDRVLLRRLARWFAGNAGFSVEDFANVAVARAVDVPVYCLQHPA